MNGSDGSLYEPIVHVWCQVFKITTHEFWSHLKDKKLSKLADSCVGTSLLVLAVIVPGTAVLAVIVILDHFIVE